MAQDMQNGSTSLAFRTEYAVEMHCQACVAHLKSVLKNQPGISSYEIDLANKRVTVEGSTSPSQIARAMKKDGRQVIVRGTGSEGGEAAVCIFESYTPQKAREGQQQDVHGIARMVQMGDTTILDLTIKHDDLASRAIANGSSSFNVSTDPSTPASPQPPSTSNGSSSSAILSQLPSAYGVYIAKTGDISAGAASAGGVLRELGQVQLRKKDGYGDLFTEFQGLNIWEMIGRAMVIAPMSAPSQGTEQQDTKLATKLGIGILAGVIARSAGAWTNDKTVCTCSGQTMWEENKSMASKF